MTLRIAINGFGRIGRNVLRALYTQGYRQDLQIVAINDLGDSAINAHLLKYDTVHGTFDADVEHDQESLTVNGDRIAVSAIRNPADLPWAAEKIDVVFECTGLFTDRAKAAAHITAGARKVIISAPAKGADATVVYGVNHDILRQSHQVISNASCTTNCLAPVAQVLHRELGIESGLMTTIHAYTNDQNLTDVYHTDPYRARSATQNMIPSKTGAAEAVGLVLPELAGKLTGMAVRVPVINVSLVDLTVQLKKRSHGRGSQRTAQARQPALEDPGLQHLAAGLQRLQPQPAVVDLRRQPHQGKRQTAQGTGLVRQRVGLLQPHAR